MAIIQTVTFGLFCDAFTKHDRQNQFSYDGKKALFNYLEELSEGIGESLELDIVALCCDYEEEDWETIAEQHSIDLTDCEDEEEKEKAVEDYLNDRTTVVGKTSVGFVYAIF